MSLAVIALLLIFILNLADGLLTLFWISRNLATELNPLMNILINKGPAAFLFVKILMPTLGLIALYKTKDEFLLSKIAIFSLLFIYTGLILYHISFLFIG